MSPQADPGIEPTDSAEPLRRADLGLAWAVRTSFLRYVVGSGGRIRVGGGAATTSSGEIYFPLAEVTRDAEAAPREVRLGGEVDFTAHGGMLHLVLRNPVLRLSAEGAELSVESPQPSSIVERVVVVDVNLGAGESSESVLMWRDAATTLTVAGAALFGGSYGAGEPMAPLTVRIPRA